MKLALTDQQERKSFFKNPERITKNDARRRKQIQKLINEKKIHTAQDYFNAALIFQHGLSLADYRKAARFALRSFKMDGGLWSGRMYAFATDRLLLAQGRKQRFGTQFRLKTREKGRGNPEYIQYIYPWNKRTSDKIRARYGVAPIAQLLLRNGKKIERQRSIPLKNDKD